MFRRWNLNLALLVSLATALTGSTQSVPSLINYQGRLTDQTGNPLSAGIYGIQFRIWDNPTSTNGSIDLIWGQQQNATVEPDGVFNVILGSPGSSPISGAAPAVNNLTFAFTATNRYLGVEVVTQNGNPIASPSEILPRQQLLSVPFAVQAQQAQIACSLSTNLSYALCPAGSIMAFGGTNIPAGWLLCDGSVVSSSQYPNLYSAISTNWGAGTSVNIGTNDFNLPDMRGMFMRGVTGARTNNGSITGSNTGLPMDPDVAARIAGSFGGNAGNNVGSLQGYQIQSHNPLMPDEVGAGNWSYGGNNWACEISAVNGSYTSASGGLETRPQNAYVNYIIKL